MSDDERSKVKSEQVSEERHAEVARQLGMGVDEITVFFNIDGEYALGRDGTRLLLLEDGAVAWYGDKAPNPTYPLVVPSVELDESDEPEPLDAQDGPKPPPKHGAGSSKEAWAAYAAEHQLVVPDGATREQIIQALDEAGVPTE